MSTSSSYGNAEDWTSILSGLGQGAASASQGASANANSKREAKEAKRKTLANLLSQSLKRNQGLFRAGQDHSDDVNDFKSQAMQQVARGFVDALNGSTNR